jgi:hypothetical protein
MAGSLIHSVNAAEPAPYKYLQVHSFTMADQRLLTNVLERWFVHVKKEVPNYPAVRFFTDDERRGYFSSVARELSEFDQQLAVVRKAQLNYREKGLPPLVEDYYKSFVTGDTVVWELQPELCFGPILGATAEQPFFMAVVANLHRGEEEAFGRQLSALNALDKKLGLETRRLVYSLRYGVDQPTFMILTPARDLLDYYSGRARRDERRRHDAAFPGIWQGLEACIRAQENVHLTFHPGLSFPPGR